MKASLTVLFIFLLAALLQTASPAFSQDLEDGTHDATVTTSSGSYTVPVEVEDGEVTTVYWPNGGDMSVRGADLDDNEASGFDSRGRSVDIEVDE